MGYGLICGPYHAAGFFGLGASGPGEPAEPGGRPCCTATNGEHVSAGRARTVLLSVYANGSNGYMGTRGSPVRRSLLQTGPGHCELVGSCP